MKRHLFFGFAILAFFTSLAIAQGDAELERLDEKFSRHLQNRLPGWKHERGEPIQGSKNVLIQYWSYQNRRIKIAITPLKSAEEARDNMKDFPTNERTAEELKGFGDQAFAWGYAGSRIYFRKGRFVVFVSTYAEVDSDPDAKSLSRSDKADRERSEMRRLSREFAQHMVSAIDLP